MIDKKESTLEKIRSINRIDGFYPEELAQTYTDLTPSLKGEPITSRMHLAVSVQKAWFRLKYPNGKIDPKVEGFSNGECVASCRVYSDYKDPESNYLAKNYATRRYDENMPSIAVRDWAVTAAIGRALTDAGFGLQFDHSGDVYSGMTPVETKQEAVKIDDSLMPFTLPEVPVVSKTAPAGPVSVPNEPVKVQAAPIAKTETQATQEPIQAIVKEQEIVPTNVEEALNTVCSLSKMKGQSFRQILVDPANAGLVKWIIKNPTRVDNPTLTAAKLLLEHLTNAA